MESVSVTPRMRSVWWKWWICALLLLASTINYMDRQTLANAAVRITTQFHLSQEQYGNLEWVFGWAFAAGSMFCGIAADRVPVRWLYPAILALWSGVGFATGLVNSYGGLLACRMLLGFFEGGHWPCAIKTTQCLLAAPDRAMGNGVLQSGASIGAVVTPLVMSAMLTAQLESWRMPFQVIGAAGLAWVMLWFVMVRSGDLVSTAASVNAIPRDEANAHRTASLYEPTTGNASSPRPSPPSDGGEGELSSAFQGFTAASPRLENALPAGTALWRLFLSRRMFVLFFVVACINTCWQTLRAWLPKFLQQGRGYSETHALYFNSLFFVATDVGCLGAGALVLWLARRGRSVDGARSAVFAGCAGLAAMAVIAALLPNGWPLLAALLLVGAGALGVFPIYHAFTQDLSAQHQGKVTGITGVAAWVLSSPAQTLFGRLIDHTGSFDLGLAIGGCLPLVAFFALWLFWKERSHSARIVHA